MTIEEMLKVIRNAIEKCEASEMETLNALLEESYGWTDRLNELADE